MQDRKTLEQFGYLTGSLIILFFGLLIPWVWSTTPSRIPYTLALLLFAAAYLVPLRLGGIYKQWMRLGEGMGWVNSRIILSILYYGMFLPIGVLMRIVRKDPLSQRWRSHFDTYRIPSRDRSKDSLERPF